MEPASTVDENWRPFISEYLAKPQELTLLIDADDTLWENNIYFLQVSQEFVASLQAHGVDPEVAALTLTETERRIIADYGYGSHSFARSLTEAYELLAPGSDRSEPGRLEAMARAIFDRDEMELRPGVREALERLGHFHRLILVTKGDPTEQDRKLTVSGLRDHFEWVEIVAEKDTSLYRELIRRLRLEPERTWMIGNSPKSDINPALAAGLQAVLIPHPQTWDLELEEVIEDQQRLLIMASLSDAAEYFCPAGKLPEPM